MSEYRLQIVATDGRVVRFRPGWQSEEGDLIRACTEAIVAQGIGRWKTESQRVAAVETGLRTVFHRLKSGVVP